MKRLAHFLASSVAVGVMLLARAASAQDEPPAGGEGPGAPPAGGDTAGGTGAPPAGGDTGAAAGGDPGAPAGGDADGDGAGMAMGVYTKANWPLELTKRPITLAAGMAEIRGDILINASKDSFFKPLAITPAVYYGVNDKLTVGINNDTLCVSGKSNGCYKAFNSLGVDAIFAFVQGPINVGAHAGVDVIAFDPFFLGSHVGVLGKYRSPMFGVVIDPQLRIGLNKRDEGNKEFLVLPIQVQFQAARPLAVFLDTGIGGPVDGFGDYYTVPLGIGALFAANNKLDVGLRFAFPLFAGPIHTTEIRTIDLLVNFRL